MPSVGSWRSTVRGRAVVNRTPVSRRISALQASIVHVFGYGSLRAPLTSVTKRFPVSCN